MFLTYIAAQVVGGDVFANWFLGVICDLKLPDSPSIVPIALGTKSNLASSLGWVKTCYNL